MFEIPTLKQEDIYQGILGNASGKVLAPMPSKITQVIVSAYSIVILFWLQILVKVGDMVKEGTALVIIEAMKMEVSSLIIMQFIYDLILSK